MARILLTWELGGALGHLMSLRPLAATFLARGHEVFLAVRDLSRTRTVFAGLNVRLLPAPSNHRRTQVIQPVVTYADLLLNIGFANDDALASHVEAWQTIFDLVKPDLLVCDHSPTALFSGRGKNFVMTTAGTGFFCPVDESPLRPLRSGHNSLHSAAMRNETLLLDVLNRHLRKRGLPVVDRVTQIYHDPQIHHFLLTFAELDHFQGRKDAKYWGTWPFGMSGQAFRRPPDGTSVFAYLKDFPALMPVLEDLSTAPFHTVAFVDALQERDRDRLQTDHLQLPRTPINIEQAAVGCDVALTNSTHGTCIAMLLQGKPLVHVPYYLEQGLFAGATGRLGASIIARTNDKFGVRRAIQHVVSNINYGAAAKRFAERYRGFRLDQVANEIVDEMEILIQSR